MSIGKNGVVQAPQFNEKFGDFSIIGTPTLTGSNLSNCSKTSYIKYVFNPPFYTSDSVITFCGSFIVPSEKNILWSVNNDYWRIRIIVTSTSIAFTNSNWAGINKTFSPAPSVGDKLYYKAVFTNGAQSLNVYKNNIEIASGTSSHVNNEGWSHEGEYVKISTICFGGVPNGVPSDVYFNTVQDLSDFLIIVDEKPVYVPFINKTTIASYQTTSNTFYEI